VNSNKNSIEIYNIKKTYDGNIPALEIKELIIPFGSVVALMGYSGSGKSTFINIISLIDVPDMVFDKENAPKIIFNLSDDRYVITYKNDKIIAKDSKNKTINEVDIRAKVFGYIFQKHYLHNNFTVEQNIQIPLIIENVQCEKLNIEKSLEFLNLPKSKAYEYPDNLSGGEAQRASILRGVIKDSQILVADEPTSSLDVVNAKHILGSFKNQVKDKGDNKLIIWVTHDIHLIAQYSDNIIVLSGGKIVNDGVVPNPGRGNEDKISSFLNTKDIVEEESSMLEFKKIDLDLMPKAKYVLNYAYKGLFKSKFNPTFDFKIGASSIVMTLLFLLFISKISHSMDALLTFKLNKPSVNNFSVIAKGGSAELDKEDVEFIKNRYKNDIRSASPVYLAPIDIKDNKSQDDLMDITDSDYVAGFRFVTFEKGDPVLETIIKKDSFLKNKESAMSAITGDKTHSLIIQTKVLEELGYDLDQKSLSIRLDTFIQDVEINAIDSILPNNVDGILRSELYFEAYFGENITQKPAMSHIVVYPNDIKESIALSMEITKSGKYSISNFYELKTKIETILDISKVINIFSQTISIALILLSISFVYLTLYRSIEKKRKEIGVFLANGISRMYFSLFYMVQAFIYFSITTIIAIGIYYFVIEAGINNFLITSSYLQANYGDIGEISSNLFLPLETIFYIFGAYFILMHSLFLFMINNFISQKPVELMKE